MAAPVRLEGLAELHRGFKAIKRDLVTELRKAEMQAAQVISVEAAKRAPRGTRPLPKNRRKRLHEAVKPAVRGTKTYVGATAAQAPHANVNHWGGVIKPRGVAITFKRRPFVIEAFEAKRPEFLALLVEVLEEVFRRNGF